MNKREQIIEILKNHIDFAYDNYGKVVNSNDLEIIADAILALPLEIPSLKEQNEEANNYGELVKPDYGVKENACLDFVRGSEWMLLEIIKRNK